MSVNYVVKLYKHKKSQQIGKKHNVCFFLFLCMLYIYILPFVELAILLYDSFWIEICSFIKLERFFRKVTIIYTNTFYKI